MQTVTLIVSRWVRSLHDALSHVYLFSSLYHALVFLPLLFLLLSLSISLTSYSPRSLGTRSVCVLYSFMAGLALSLPLIRSGIMVWIRWWKGMPVLLTTVAISSHHFKVMCLMPFPPLPFLLCIITQLQEEWQTLLISCLLAVHYKGVKQDFSPAL